MKRGEFFYKPIRDAATHVADDEGRSLCLKVNTNLETVVPSPRFGTAGRPACKTCARYAKQYGYSSDPKQ